MTTETLPRLAPDAEAARVAYLTKVNADRRALIEQMQTGRTPAANAEERARLKAQLRAAVEVGARLQAEYDAQVGETNRAINETGYLKVAIRNAESQLKAWRAPLDPLTFPSAAQLSKQAEQIAVWERTCADLTTRLAAAVRRSEGVLELVKLRDAIQRQQWVIANIRTLAEGGRVGYPEGGISTSEDLIGNTQMPPR
jgi:hypothetical protein